MMRHPHWLAPRVLGLGLCLGACSEPAPAAPTAPSLAMDFAAVEAGELFAAPFPGSHLVDADGTLALDALPTNDVVITERLRDLLALDARGFGTSSAIYFTSSDDLATDQLPSPRETTRGSSTVFVESVDDESPDFGRRYPIEVEYRSGARHGGVEGMLSLLPVPGIPLREGTLYAAGVTTELRTERDERLVPAAALTRLLREDDVPGLEEPSRTELDRALDALADHGTNPETLAALTVFRTDSPTRGLFEAHAALSERPLPEVRGLGVVETFADYCVYEGLVGMPTFQGGNPPYLFGGGAWQYSETELVEQGLEEARVVLSVPRTAVPESGFPAVVFARVGAGGDRPLVDRGVHTEPGASSEPGTGPALELARAGFAALSIDGPHGGLRNTLNADEQLLIYNYTNPVALRDNLRQSALELALHVRLLSTLELASTDCEGVEGTIRFDSARVATFGHSMGASITPLTAAIEPGVGAVILSGAGASFIENVVYKLSPFEILPTASELAGLPEGELLERHDPLLSLLQWAGEPADAPLYARRLLEEADGSPRHVLLFQGLIDSYIPPPIANALTLSLGVDVAGEALELEGDAPSCDEARCEIEPLLSLVDRARIALPARGNRDVDGLLVTATLVQHEGDGIEDAHEVVFQRPEPKAQYREFLASWRRGTPEVPDASSESP